MSKFESKSNNCFLFSNSFIKAFGSTTIPILKEQLDLEITIDTLEDAYIEEITPEIFSLDVYALSMEDMQDLIHLLEERGK